MYLSKNVNVYCDDPLSPMSRVIVNLWLKSPLDRGENRVRARLSLLTVRRTKPDRNISADFLLGEHESEDIISRRRSSCRLER